MRANSLKVETTWIVGTAARIADGDDRRPELGHQVRGDRTGIAESLHRRRCLCQIEIENPRSALDGEDAAAARGLVASFGSPEHDRLTGCHAGHRVPDI